MDMRRYAHWWLDRCFLYVGRIAETKGVRQILEAWLGLAKDLDRDCPPIWLVGGEVEEIEAMRRAIGIERLAPYEEDRRVQWWGYLDAPGISAVMLKAYVLVLHSLYEPGGRVVLESMTQGIPVIATPHGFALDLVVDWHSGFLVNYGDIAALQTRMGHFALQPLLRHAMGRRAQEVAVSALEGWRFLEAHVHVYESASRRDLPRVPDAPGSRIYEPPPQGFAGAYPFEAEKVKTQDVAAFFQQYVGSVDATVSELVGASGRSRIWLARAEDKCWVIKHAFSTYRKRPMWDRGFGAELAEYQRERISGEMLGAQADGAVPLLAADPRSGLTLREWVEQAPSAGAISVWASLVARFHRTAKPVINLEPLRARVDRDWASMPDHEVVKELLELDAHWRSEQRSWNAWSPISLRLGWRWLELGLRRNWLTLPENLSAHVGYRIREEARVAAAEEPLTCFGLCHGDPDPAHFRLLNDGGCALIDCERCHPGFFGHDWAGVILDMLRDMDDDGTRATLNQALSAIDRTICPPRAHLSWLRLTTLMRLCRAHGLMELGPLNTGLRVWNNLERMTSP